MKAISLYQPWAMLIAIGAKRIETRSWATLHRGELAIHAGKYLSRKQREFAYRDAAGQVLNEAGILLGGDCRALPLGAIVAIADVVDVLPTARIVREGWLGTKTGANGVPFWMAGRYEREFGDYGPKRYGWLLAHVRRLAQPVPCVGRQRLFNLPDDIERRVRLEAA